MELDELKQKWAEHDRKLETNIRLNRQLLREIYTRRARFALLRMAAILALGSLFLLAVIVFLGAFIHKYLGMPELVWPAVVLDAFAIAALAALNLQIALALQTDYDKPVAVIQKRLERLRKIRIRYAQGIFLTMTLTWAPMFIVFMQVFLGVDVYRAFDRSWLIWNVGIGFAIAVLGIWLARKYGDRVSHAGYNWKAAAGFIATLARFEEEEPEA
jgi:MFS family permease